MAIVDEWERGRIDVRRGPLKIQLRKCRPERRRIADSASHERWAAAKGSRVGARTHLILVPNPEQDCGQAKLPDLTLFQDSVSGGRSAAAPEDRSAGGEAGCCRGYRSFGRRQDLWQQRFTSSG